MTENSSLSAVTQHFEPQTSDEKVWRSPGYHVVETALEVTAYALTDRRPPEPPPAA
ncbi:pyrroloquinoline quinone precursor peptide PqqA [Streptomyces alanosinicus]|nr:pyrroloquinoline quinone precursor peptide PqqA [Streptomyces alanosinicus]